MPVTATADKMRRLMHWADPQSHALHFFHLSSPDLLQPVSARRRGSGNIVGVAQAHPDIARQGAAAQFGR